MKRLFLILFFIAGCNLPADNDPKMIRGVWDANPEPDLSHYEVYWWEGNDTLNWQPTMLQLIETVPHSFIADSIMSDSFQVILDYVVVGAIAVDSTGYTSLMGYSRIWSYAEMFAPGPPLNVRINN